MKSLILLLLLSATSYTVFSQLTSQIQAKRGVFTEQLYLNGRWINRITSDMNSDDTTSDNVIATAKSVADYIRSKIKPVSPVTLQQVFSAGGALTQTNIINGGNNLFVWNNNLANNYLYRFRIDNANVEVTRTIYRPDFSTASDFTQSPENNSLVMNPGGKMVSQIQQWKDGGMYMGTTGSLYGNESSIMFDTTSLIMASGIVNWNAQQHMLNVYRDSIVIEGHINGLSGPLYNTRLFFPGLPASTLSPAYDLQTNSSGQVFQKVAPKVYTALLSQTGTTDPVVTILGTNSLGTIAWTRNSTGSYTGTLTGAFPNGKTFVIIGDANGSTDSALFIKAFRASDNTINISMQNSGQQVVDEFNNVPIEIRVYP